MDKRVQTHRTFSDNSKETVDWITTVITEETVKTEQGELYDKMNVCR